MPAIALDQIENAIYAWVQPASGLDDQHVQWSLLGEDQPEPPYIELSHSSLGGSNYGWRRIDRNPAVPVLPAPGVAGPGNELRVRTQAQCKGTLRIQGFGAAKSGSAIYGVVNDVVAALNADTLYTLGVAGVAISKVGTIQFGGSKRSTLLLPRAFVDVTILVMSEVVTYGTYIETVDVAVEVTTAESTTDVRTITVTDPSP